MTTAKKLLLTIAIASGLVLLAGGVAMAAGTAIPHGGYGTATDACLQCHDIHESANDYVLLRWATVTDTCGSCHYLFLTAPSSANGSFGQGSFNASPNPGKVPAYAPGYSGNDTEAVPSTENEVGVENSIGSRTSAYEVAAGNQYTANGHNLQRGNSGAGPFYFKDGQWRDADYIPGGWDMLNAIERGKYPNSVVSTTNFSGTNGLFCASCHTPHGEFGQLLADAAGTPVSAKILSSKPNHSSSALVIDDFATEGGKWCEKCHQKRAPEAVNPSTGEIYHNHPDRYCLDCHANADGSPNGDFPHTGANQNLLFKVPDALCLECHQSGLIP